MKKKFMLIVLCVAVAAAVALPWRVVDAKDTTHHIDVTAKRFTYSPNEITLKKGQPVVLVIKSLDVAHGLHISELNLKAKIPKGGSTELNFTPDKTGDFVGHCSVFCGSGHGGMALTLHVVD
jgi:cytochrome c oxidase subunit 2